MSRMLNPERRIRERRCPGNPKSRRAEHAFGLHGAPRLNVHVLAALLEQDLRRLGRAVFRLHGDDRAPSLNSRS